MQTKTFAAVVALGAIFAGMSFGPTATAAPCTGNADGGGWGDNYASCGWRCDGGQRLSVTVRSDDNDADVRGSAQCASREARCGWSRQVCDGTSAGDVTDGPADGTCEGWSDEAWESPLTVTCNAIYDCGASCGDYECDVCGGQDMGENAKRKSDSQAQSDGGTTSQQTSTAWSAALPVAGTADDAVASARAAPAIYGTVTITVGDGVASAVACVLGKCLPVEPACEFTADYVYCRVG